MDEKSIQERVQEIYDLVLKELRKTIKESGLTEEALADLCDVSQAAINRIKRGKRGLINIPFKSVLKLTIGLNIDLAGLLFASEPDKQAQIKAILSEISKMVVSR